MFAFDFMSALCTHELFSTSTLRRSSRNHLYHCAVCKAAAKHKPSRHAQAICHWRPPEECNRVFQVTLVSCVIQVQRVFQQVLQADKCQMGGERSARLIDRRRHVLISSMISSFASLAVDHSLGWFPHCQSGPAYLIHVTLWQDACISLVAVFQFLQACLVAQLHVPLSAAAGTHMPWNIVMLPMLQLCSDLPVLFPCSMSLFQCMPFPMDCVN